MIKAKGGYEFRKTKSQKKWHLVDTRNACLECAAYRIVATASITPTTKVNEPEICKHCLKIARKRGLIEEVPEHIAAMPKGYRIMEVGEVITDECKFWRNNEGPWQPFLGADEAYAIDGLVSSTHHPICCPVESQKPAEVIDKPVQDPIKVKLHEYECRAKAAEDEVAELKAKIDALEELENNAYTMFKVENKARVEAVKEVAELKSTLASERGCMSVQNITIDVLRGKIKKIEVDRDDLAASNDELNEDDAKQTKLLCDYGRATNGHAMEDIKTIIEAGPSPEDLEGCSLEYRLPTIGDTFYNRFREWITCNATAPTCKRLVRTPIIEYIPTEEITDELAKQRPQAQFRDNDGNAWSDTPYMLVHVRTDLAPNGPYIDNKWRHCRIKRSTIDKSRAKRNIAK
jgi:hypothetical protein